MLSIVCFSFVGRVHVISTGPISTVQRSGVLHHPTVETKLLPQALTSALLDTDRNHKTALTAEEKRYLAVYSY
ncbi:unnamed protein product [Staurois parvus]|uniref:Uncharacterized protein n=1 Tax=Staurois parvus TaxID=386267 RepID=A0ABN9HKP6_9NEOB|nr:unnamed protein product [Staurois parvus]